MDRYGERIYRVARRMVGHTEDAEDVTQTVLLKLLQKAGTFRGDSDPMGWIYRITVNEAREHHRRRGRRPAVSLEALPADVKATAPSSGISDRIVPPDRAALGAEVEDVVTAAVGELPDGYREAVILVDLEGLSYRDAAEVLGLGLGGFKTRLHRARLYLRARLGAFWHSPGGRRRSEAGRGGNA